MLSACEVTTVWRYIN